MADRSFENLVDADITDGWYHLCRNVRHIQSRLRGKGINYGLGDIHLFLKPFVEADRLTQSAGGYSARVVLEREPKVRVKEQPVSQPLPSLKTVMAYKPHHQGAQTKGLISQLLVVIDSGRLPDTFTSKQAWAALVGCIGQQVKRALDILVQAGVLTFQTEGKRYIVVPEWRTIAAASGAGPNVDSLEDH